MLPKVDYWTLKPSKDVKLYKKPSKKQFLLETNQEISLTF